MFSTHGLLRSLTSVRTTTTCVQLLRHFSPIGSSVDQREAMQYDVCIVGAGPAGLSSAIKLLQLSKEQGKPLSVCVVEKGAEVGAHILSGNVFEPRALNELLPDWKEDPGVPVKTEVVEDSFYYLSEKGRWRLPHPRGAGNKGNYIVSLSELCRWLCSKAEELGAEVYPGFAAKEVLYDWEGAVTGIATNDFGVDKDGHKKNSFSPGVELRAKLTLFAEGCRGSLSKQVLRRYNLVDEAAAQHQTYALGIKEVWEVPESQHAPGTVVHTLGYPLGSSAFGGGFLYHMSGNRVSLGLVTALDYKDPYLSPYGEFQRWKLHPLVAGVLAGGTCLQYGARTLNEGGVQSVPQLAFPGGALVGCSAGFVNTTKVKGTHTAMKSGMLAAEAAFEALTRTAAQPTTSKGASKAVVLKSYDSALRNSWLWEELWGVRNVRPAFSWGFWPGLLHAGLNSYMLRGREGWTLKHGLPDHEALRLAAGFSPRSYPKPDGRITFDLATSLFRSGTNHDHDQPSHLRLCEPGLPEIVNKAFYDGPESRYCPAGVYEYVQGEDGRQHLQISAQNCLHCKACDVKDPRQNIQWTVPEGGGGPSYTVM